MYRHNIYTCIQDDSSTPILQRLAVPETAHILLDCQLATLCGGANPYGLVPDAALVIEGGHIAWIGPRHDLPADRASLPIRSLGARLVTPALIPYPTLEFPMRLQTRSSRIWGRTLQTMTPMLELPTPPHRLMKDAVRRLAQNLPRPSLSGCCCSVWSPCVAGLEPNA